MIGAVDYTYDLLYPTVPTIAQVKKFHSAFISLKSAALEEGLRSASPELKAPPTGIPLLPLSMSSYNSCPTFHLMQKDVIFVWFDAKRCDLFGGFWAVELGGGSSGNGGRGWQIGKKYCICYKWDPFKCFFFFLSIFQVCMHMRYS